MTAPWLSGDDGESNAGEGWRSKRSGDTQKWHHDPVCGVCPALGANHKWPQMVLSWGMPRESPLVIIRFLL